MTAGAAQRGKNDSVRTIAVVTGTRAEFGLLRTVMRTIRSHPRLTLRTIVTGTHLLPPACTIDEIASEFAIDAAVPMQREGVTGRFADADALGRGVTGLASALAMVRPDITLVLGDRIEALAAALASAVAGIRIAHLHGGDRAEGIADESMRHAITKLAHLHLPATAQSAERIIKMGEHAEHVHVVGSPAIDGLADIPPLADDAFASLGSPEVVFLMHPDNSPPDELFRTAAMTLAQCMRAGRTLALHPNHDPGREAIMQAIERSGCAHRAHLPRDTFVGLLKRVRVLAGNSSAGLIEATAVGVPVINIGPRQAGREAGDSAVHVQHPSEPAIRAALQAAFAVTTRVARHPFGDGRTGVRVAELLARLDLANMPLAKRNSY